MLKSRKFYTILLVVLALVLVVALVCACGGDPQTPDPNPNPNPNPNPDPDPDPTPDPSKKNITGVTFGNVTVDYDGLEHEILVSGEIPDDVSVSYTGNKGTDAGTYNATATLSGEGYNTLNLTAKLTINKIDITGVTFDNATVTYDGSEHEIKISGNVPNGVAVSYTGNTKGTNAGEYSATATLSGKNYNTLTLNATLTIEKAEIVGITFSGATFEYDAKPHSIQIVGNVPSGVTTEYYYNGEKANSATEVGSYEVKAVLSGQNHITLELTATLKINSTEEMLYSAVFDGAVYFQNSLDGNKLYRLTSSGTLEKVSNDVATYFTSNSTELYFYSGGLLSQRIKSLSSGTPTSVFDPGRATYLACDDNGNIYYAKANLIDTKKENGIYKVNISSSTQEPVRLTEDKADYIAYYDGYIYYCNTSKSSKLYRISVNANNGTGELLVDNKVSDIIVEDGYVYFTQHDTAAAIYKYNISTKVSTKLCIDNGAYLTKINDEIYYVNKDLLTSNIFGKGIYKVPVDGSRSLIYGEKVLEADDGDGYYSLSSDGSFLYYYRKNDKHFYRYNISLDSSQDLMNGFTPKEDATFSSYPYAQLAIYDGEIYYTNVLDGNSLYKYNPQTGANYKVIDACVSNVYFHNGYMFYSTYVITNYALWRLDLSNSEAEPEKISSSRYENLIFDGDHFYAVRISVPGAHRNYIIRMDLDGQNETELYTDKNVHVTKLYLFDGKFHFTINPTVGYKYIYTHGLDEAENVATSIEVKSDNFVISNGRYYYYDHTANKLMSCTLEGKDIQTLASNVDITDIYEHNGVVYYTSKSSQNTGIYAYNVSTGGTPTRLTANVGHGFQVVGDKLYFISISLTYTTDYPYRASGDGHLYSIDLSSNELARLA